MSASLFWTEFPKALETVIRRNEVGYPTGVALTWQTKRGSPKYESDEMDVYDHWWVTTFNWFGGPYTFKESNLFGGILSQLGLARSKMTTRRVAISVNVKTWLDDHEIFIPSHELDRILSIECHTERSWQVYQRGQWNHEGRKPVFEPDREQYFMVLLIKRNGDAKILYDQASHFDAFEITTRLLQAVEELKSAITDYVALAKRTTAIN